MKKTQKDQKQITEEQFLALAHQARENLLAFTSWCNKEYRPSWFHRVIADALMKVEQGEIKRLMIFMPPRHGKSELATKNFPAWYIGRHPDKEVVSTSYNAELAQIFGYDVRNLVTGHAYKALFGDLLREDSQSKARMVTQEGGSYSAIGVGGALTGRGADILIIDDPIKGRENADSKTVRDLTWNWFASTAYTRLYKHSAVIVVQTRWHMDDLSGRILEKMDAGGEQWTIINFPAIAQEDELVGGKLVRKQGDPLWPEQFPLPLLNSIKEVIGVYEWSSLYMQNPITSENQEFQPEWIQKITWDEIKKVRTRRFLSVDTAISKTDDADMTGLCLNFVDEHNNWHFKAWKLRINPKQLIDLIFQLHAEYNIEKVGIEETTYLLTLKPFFDEECRKRGKFPYVVPLKHMNTQKETRIRALIPRYETKSIYHIENSCKDLEEQMLTFPKGKHDDVIDAAAYQVQIAVQAYKQDAPKIRPFKQTSFA